MDFEVLLAQHAIWLRQEGRRYAHIGHYGERGRGRENALAVLLRDGLLPRENSIGTGFVLGTNGESSQQCDIIISDAERCPSFLDDFYYPSLGVKGIIEVKSALSKAELDDAIRKIARFKRIRHADPAKVRSGRFPIMYSDNDGFPFGVVFAYSVADNSLASLTQNVVDAEKGLQPFERPNMVCVLDEGLILHASDGHNAWHTVEVSEAGASPIGLKLGLLSFSEFYKVLVDLVASVTIKPFDVSLYRNVSRVVDKTRFSGEIRTIDGDGHVVSVTDDFLKSIRDGKTGEALGEIEDMIGIPVERRLVAVNSSPLNVYVYDPSDVLPDEHEVTGSPYGMMARCRLIFIDGAACFVPRSYFQPDRLTSEPL